MACDTPLVGSLRAQLDPKTNQRKEDEQLSFFWRTDEFLFPYVPLNKVCKEYSINEKKLNALQGTCLKEYLILALWHSGSNRDLECSCFMSVVTDAGDTVTAHFLSQTL